ncbi:hypothetical protein ACSG7Y_000307 [Enterococcus faecalis]|uniref:hypothetical protein n=1 Tax=Enterococcus faecalis TaxID=1351 RepID=UPI0029C90190|nr:hypothetical protein [Enterococcus faecalis]WPH43272.1 hypothetical protein SHT70_12620 [Enterococcus faecalis]WPH44444.1 hypothetical protein SHT70_03425 [Enterococcus faecalis]
MSELRHQEIIDRVHYMYLQTDGTIEFPNSFEGDLLKIAYGTAVQSIKQPQLNENQQIVLDWLKNDMLDDSDFYNTIYNSRFLHVNGEPHRKENIAFMKLKNKELAQVIQAFSQWSMEQEEE